MLVPWGFIKTDVDCNEVQLGRAPNWFFEKKVKLTLLWRHNRRFSPFHAIGRIPRYLIINNISYGYLIKLKFTSWISSSQRFFHIFYWSWTPKSEGSSSGKIRCHDLSLATFNLLSRFLWAHVPFRRLRHGSVVRVHNTGPWSASLGSQ